MNDDIRSVISDEANELYQQKIKREKHYTSTLKTYINCQKDNMEFKKKFKQWYAKACCFMFVVPGILVLCIFVSVCLCMIIDAVSPPDDGVMFVQKYSVDILTWVASSVISFVASVKYLTKIIAEYMFNRDDEKNFIKIINSIQRHDEKL